MATYYINADTGNDTTGNGSSANPWLTFAKALTSSTSLDTIYLQGATGTYNFMYQSGAYAGGSYSSRTIRGDSAATSVFDGAGGDSRFMLSSNWNFYDVTFQNVVDASPYYGVISYSNQSSAIGTATFTRCIFKNITTIGGVAANAQGGIFSAFAANNPTYTFKQCIFYNLLSGATAGKIFNTTNTLSVNMTNCVIAITDTVNMITSICGGSGGSGKGTYTFKNTAIANYSGGTVTYGPVPSDLTMSYCDNYLMTSVPSGTGNITTDPLFIDPTTAGGNFLPQPTSPLWKAGNLI